MADPSKPRTVTVDPAAAKRADEALDALIEAEVRRRIDQDRTNMDAAQMQAAIQAAEKRAADSLTKAEAVEKKLGDAIAAVEKLTKSMQERFDSERSAEEKETLRRARFYADKAKGLKGDALEAEAKRLAGLGRAAVDELLTVTPAPSADPLMVAVGGSPPAGTQGGHPDVLVSTKATKDGRSITTYTLNNPALTVPGYKAPGGTAGATSGVRA